MSSSHFYFSFGIIFGRLWRSLAVEDHLRSILGIICGLWIICGWGSFAVLYSCSQRKTNKIINIQSSQLLSQNLRGDPHKLWNKLLPLNVNTSLLENRTVNQYIATNVSTFLTAIPNYLHFSQFRKTFTSYFRYVSLKVPEASQHETKSCKQCVQNITRFRLSKCKI